VNKNELINIIDECLCHFKNGAITYTRKDLIDKIIEAVDLYHDSEVKKLNIPAVVGRSESFVCGHPPKRTYLIDGTWHCEECGGKWESIANK
jgi:hypothetical protein